MLREPRFQEDRLALAKEQALQEMKKRNDDTADIEAREWESCCYGEDHFTNRFTTAASVAAITRDDLAGLPPQVLPPGQHGRGGLGHASTARRCCASSRPPSRAGPFPKPVVPPVPSTINTAAPGLYRIQKDVNQGRVSIGLPTVKRDNPDIYALEVMNEILGGSGFTARITSTVRSNEGLAYSAGSGLILRRLLSRPLPRRVPVQEPHRRRTPPTWCWPRSARCASRP